MTPETKTVSAEHLQEAVDQILGIDPTQAPTEPAELSSRLTVPQPGMDQAVELLLNQQNVKHLRPAVSMVYVILEAAQRAYPDDMTTPIRSKAFATSVAAVAPEAKSTVDGSGHGELGRRQPVLVGWLDKQLLAEDSYAAKLTSDDRTGVYALVLAVIRAVDKQLVGAAGPVRAAKLPGRNDPCPCESGKKYKKCHGGPNPPQTPLPSA